MEAGRELDALVAEKIMGWTPSLYTDHTWEMVRPNSADGLLVYAVPEYSTEIEHAWKVFEKLRESGDFCCLWIKSDYNYVYDVTWVYENNDDHAEQSIGYSVESAPLAICLTALKIYNVQ